MQALGAGRRTIEGPLTPITCVVPMMMILMIVEWVAWVRLVDFVRAALGAGPTILCVAPPTTILTIAEGRRRFH